MAKKKPSEVKTVKATVKEKVIGAVSSLSGLMGVFSSWTVCHNVCTAAIALLAIIGITAVGMPLLFLQKVAVPFWTAAVIIFSVLLLLRLRKMGCISGNMLMLNAGFIIAGIPFRHVQQFSLLFWLIGGALVSLSAILFFKERINIKERGNTERNDGRIKRVTSIKVFEDCFAYEIIVLVVITLIFSLSSFAHFDFSKMSKMSETKPVSAGAVSSGMEMSLSSMTLTEFDIQLAKQLMDKNSDGMCDFCGMRIEDCIKSGMIQCSMDPNKQIGVLGTQHIHADWKVYVDGKLFNWAPYADRHERQMAGDLSINDTSAFIHIHPAQAPEQAGDVLHMHATGIPLHMLFESLGIKLPNNIKLYVNGKLNPEGLNYVFKDLDKILITDSTGETTVQEQLNSITDYAKDHSKPNALEA